MSQLISDEDKDTMVSEMYNYIFPDEEIILPSSVESIEKTEVLVRGVTAVKIYFKVSENAEKDILNGDSVVTISSTGKIKEFTNTTEVYTISFKYTYPLVGPNYKPSESDVPRLV